MTGRKYNYSTNIFKIYNIFFFNTLITFVFNNIWQHFITMFFTNEKGNISCIITPNSREIAIKDKVFM
jgi:hypothetical protein